MTTRYTDEEWSSIIAGFAAEVSITERPRSSPLAGSAALAAAIDHTLLKLDATSQQVDALCAEARVLGFATVCVRPCHVAQAAADLKGSGIHVTGVVGFPEGTHEITDKVRETRRVLIAGAQELNIALNWPRLQQGQYDAVYNELATIRAAAAPEAPILSLILEISQLSRQDIIAACVIADYARFDYVQTSTGFMGAGATIDNVRLMKAVCERLEKRGGKRMRVKASGGIRTLEDAQEMLRAGASRLGTSAGVWIAKEGREVRGIGRTDDGANRPGLATRLFSDY
ncbi:hypothetical protein AAFC00_005696 [Neodothiora populina]|uniref:deoxyribose-phosphate aldolase n=1 Tax=Neodothiora populina TaxID=2781224 RepID=A0ABR3P5W0_9PEZI